MCTNSVKIEIVIKILRRYLVEDDTQGCRCALEMTGSIVPILRVERFNSNHLAYFTGSHELSDLIKPVETSPTTALILNYKALN